MSPWMSAMTDLFPCPQLPIVSLISLAVSFWYGYRHPEGN